MEFHFTVSLFRTCLCETGNICKLVIPNKKATTTRGHYYLGPEQKVFTVEN